MKYYAVYFEKNGMRRLEFLAPNEDEAIKQFSCAVKDNCDIIHVGALRYIESYCRDTKSGNIITEDELYKKYAELYPAREATFVEFLKHYDGVE